VATYFPFVQFMAAVADAIVLGVGAGLIASGHLTTGVLLAFILYVDLFFSPIQQLSQVFDAWQQTRVSVHRNSQLLHVRTRTPLAEYPEQPGRLRGDIVCDDVRFSYPMAVVGRPGVDGTRRGPLDPRLPAAGSARPAAPEALRGISLRIAAGETVALVGETG